MNKKILALAFVSAAFFFGCSADGSFNSKNPAPDDEYEDEPSNGKYCSIQYPLRICQELSSTLTAEDCSEIGGVIVNSCP